MKRLAAGVLLAAILMSPAESLAQELANGSFTLRYDPSGIRNLRRTNDIHDTDYIAANGTLGRLLIRYRTTRNGDWRELREMLLTGEQNGQSISYVMGAIQPTLASRSSGSAATGAAGIRGLNDGLVPSPAGGGRGGGPGVQTPDAPLFTWAGSRGPTQWVQYTFPDDHEVSSAEVFWVRPPRSWRLIYQDGGQWKEVASRTPYGVAPGAFSRVEFTPVRTMSMRIEATMSQEDTVSIAEWRVGDPPAIVPVADLQATQTFALNGNTLDWTLRLRNNGSRPVEIGDLAVPFNFAERTGARGDIYTKKLLRHAYIGGHGSFVYWQRSNGEGPYLVMTPMEETKFEYYDSSGGGAGFGAFTPYIHAKAAKAAVEAGFPGPSFPAVEAGFSRPGTRTGSRPAVWRLPVSGLALALQQSVVYSFRFEWAKDFAAVRDVLFHEGKIDTAVVPGMVVPSDLTAMISLRTKHTIKSIEPEYPGSTTVVVQPFRAASPVGQPFTAANTYIYCVRFSRLGENLLKVKYGDDKWSTLEFFVTEPLETVIKKRAAFLVSHHQHKDPPKWYVGMYSDWDQKNEILRSPEDRDGLSTWLTDANDDAGNARPAFIASKNVFFPDQKEIESLELYISKYLWGGMQMTDKEKYPYAAALKFMNFQLLLNMSDRGWLEHTYYQLGSDYRGNLSYLLSYMSQMGGWSILDYGLHFAGDPADYLRLGYASSLSSWALVNSGTAESGYGYWFPSPNNDGATGGGFMPEAVGRAWIGKQMARGAWYYSAEEDVGYCGALRTHATIVTRDPVFGEFAYGGELTRTSNLVSVIPRDGLRVRFHVIRDQQRLHLELGHDGFAREQAIVVSDTLDRVRFVVENRAGQAHQTGLSIVGLPRGAYTVSVDGRSITTISGGAEKTTVQLPVSASTARVTLTRSQ